MEINTSIQDNCNCRNVVSNSNCNCTIGQLLQAVAEIADDNKKIDWALQELKQLIDPQWKAWHASKARLIGVEQYLKIGSIAKSDGKNPAKYFTYLLRKAVDKHA